MNEMIIDLLWMRWGVAFFGLFDQGVGQPVQAMQETWSVYRLRISVNLYDTDGNLHNYSDRSGFVHDLYHVCE